MIDVKKLITGFLILAVAAVCSGVILSFMNGETTTPALQTPQVAISGGTAPTIAGNAFVPNAAQLAGFQNPASSTLIASSSDPNNLTDVLATAFVNGVVTANPNGPVTRSDTGNPTIMSPSLNAIAMDPMVAAASADLQIPNWNVEANSIPIITSSDSSPTKVFQYGTAVNSILSNHINTQVQDILNNQNGSNAGDLAYVESQVQSALRDTASLTTPVAAENFQKSLLTVLVYEKNMLQLMDISQTDPVKASLVLNREDSKFALAQQNLQNQAQSIANLTVSLQPAPIKDNNIFLSFINDTFGIPQAYAQWSVFDPANWSLTEANEIQTIGHQVETTVKNTLLQILKNTLMTIVQQKVLTWVNGSGAPRFITSWGDTLVNSYEQSALNAINNKMSCGVYPAFIPQIKITLGNFYQSATNNSCANLFASALGANTFQQFQNNFANGGFIAYGASSLPSGNPYGGLFFNAQIIDYTAQNAKTAALAKATAANGFKGDQICDDGSNPNTGEHTVCENPDGPDYTINNATSSNHGTESCGPGDTPVVYANAGTTCDDGTEPQVTTPGEVTGFSLSTALGGTTQQIASANDIAGLLSSVVGSLLNSLANAAVTAAGQAVNNGLASLNASNLSGGAMPPAPIPLACSPSTQTIHSVTTTGSPLIGPVPTSTLPVTVSAIGGTTDASGNFPTYYWISSNGATSTGSSFSEVLPNPGSYTVTLSDSSGSDTPVTCSIIVQ